MNNKNACQVIFHAEGFDPQTDLPDMQWELLKSEFVTMYNAFADGTNSILEKINHIWNNLNTLSYQTILFLFLNAKWQWTSSIIPISHTKIGLKKIIMKWLKLSMQE